MRARCLAALGAAAAVSLVPAAAEAAARDVPARVIAPAVDRGKVAVLPVLLSPGARRPVLRVRVRGERPVRQGSVRFALAQLQPGDRLLLSLDGRDARAIELRESGPADAFADVATTLRRASRAAARARDALAPIVAGDADADRDRVRDRIVDASAQVQGARSRVGATLRGLRRVTPQRGARKAAVVAAQARYAGRLEAVHARTRQVVRLANRAAAALSGGAPIGESGSTVGEESHGGGGEFGILVQQLGAFLTEAQAVDQATRPARPPS